MLSLISRPSSFVAEKIQDRIEHETALMHHECLWALRFLYGNDSSWSQENNEFAKCASEFFNEYLSMENKTQTTGIFGIRIPMIYREISRSSCLHAHLAPYLRNFQGVNLTWYH